MSRGVMTLSSEIDAARSAEDKKGFASLLNVARAFLKDNGSRSASRTGPSVSAR
jgi:hypothetical protein